MIAVRRVRLPAALAGRPVFVQRAELGAARGPDCTVHGVVDFPGARYEVLDGETEVAPCVHLVPTHGHTAEHQSLLLDGGLLLAGRTHLAASAWTADAEAVRRPDRLAPPPEWFPALLDRVTEARSAHDAAVWHA